MTSQIPAKKAELLLRFLLRLMGSFSLSALIFVFVPHAWMNEIHRMLGMGELPNQPVVGYLARSTSAFYALSGGLFWALSFDLARYRPLLGYLAYGVIFLGWILLLVDWMEGMPLFWKLWEGPFVILFGLILRVLCRALEANT